MAVKGNNKHLNYLRHLEKNIKRAMYLGGKLVEDKAQDYAPVEKGVMMRSVTTTPPLDIEGKIIVFVGPGPEVPYAKYTEEEKYMKTKSGKKKQPGSKSRMKGAKIPWLKPALDDQKDDILDIISSAVVNTRT